MPTHIPTPNVDPVIVRKQAQIFKQTWPAPTLEAWSQQPEFCKLYSLVKEHNLPNFLGTKITLDSGLNLENWEKMLYRYHDRELCYFLRYGWPVGYHLPTPPQTTDSNHSQLYCSSLMSNNLLTKNLPIRP